MRFLLRLLNKLKLLKYFNLTMRSDVNDHVFSIPIIGGLGMSNLTMSEPWMIEVLHMLTEKKRDLVYLDIGVNIGQTLMKLKSIDPKMPYIGFEPNPICIFYTNRLIELNNFKNVTLFPCGVSNLSGLYELSFFSSDDADSTASMIDNFRPNQRIYKKEHIACFNIGEVISERNLPSVGIIKIDVEGGELSVLEGLKRIILKDKPYIQIEILPVYSIDNKDRLTRQNKIEELLQEWDYVLLRINHGADGFENLMQIESIGIHSNMNWCEYLFIPKDEISEMEEVFG